MAMVSFADAAELIRYLQSLQAINARSEELFNLGLAGDLDYFKINLGNFDRVVDYVDQITQQTYPDLNIPLHSRWRHFPEDQIERLFTGLSSIERVKAKLDLAIPSILLDAGAGNNWRYVDVKGQTWQRSEGLAIASLEMFASGLLAAKGGLQTDAIGLSQLTLERLQQAFQVTAENPIVGLEGRLQLLQNLGQALLQSPELFGSKSPRLGNLVHTWQSNNSSQSNSSQSNSSQQVSVQELLSIVLSTFGNLWPQRLIISGKNLGDVWTHPKLTPLAGDETSRYIPFHKLSQWLACSLIEPLQEWGLIITDLDLITGLAEYRNGGLFIDLDVLQLRDPSQVTMIHRADSVLVVEWRGLTLHLLRLLTDRLRQRWNQDKLFLIQALQGGSWAAGRTIAAQLRPQAAPPLQIDSDGTVF